MIWSLLNLLLHLLPSPFTPNLWYFILSHSNHTSFSDYSSVSLHELLSVREQVPSLNLSLCRDSHPGKIVF